MPFSSSFCLTNTGSLQLGTSVDFYSDEDNYTDPFQTDILLSNITGNNCPYVLNGIPDGTTILQILDVNSSCCVEIPISTFTCDDCNFGFDVYSSVTFNSRIVAGNLTASCDNNITDYVIEWYNVNDLTTPLYISGFGDEFEDILQWEFPHPLTGIGAIPALPGTYRPVIKYIRLNGINYSSDLEDGLVQIPLDNCLSTTTIDVNPLTCDNGNITGDYTHLLQFSGSSQGQPPTILSATFILSPDTNYFAWRFNAFDVQDTIRILYFGTHYNNTPILLESFNVGNNNVGVNYQPTPKIVKTNNNPIPLPGFPKVTCLTGLTRSENDFLILEIIPNQLNPKTDFQLYFTCLESYNCSICYDNFLNTGYRILGSTITGETLSCGRVNLSFGISGCSQSQLSISDYYKYSYTNAVTIGGNNSLPSSTNGVIYIGSVLTTGQTRCLYSEPGRNQLNPCFPASDETITFSKTNTGPNGTGFVYMTFTSLSDLSDYFNTFQQRRAQTGNETDPTQIGYYRYISLRTPIPENVDDLCGDSTRRLVYEFHISTVVTTGVTNNVFFMSLTMPTITRQINFENCQLDCLTYINDVVRTVNVCSTATTNNFQWVSNVGSRLTIPFPHYGLVTISATASNTGNTASRFVRNDSFLNKTLPMSGTNNTLIPTISSTTCNLVGEINSQNLLYSEFYERFLFQYRIQSDSQTFLNNFQILATNIINGQRNGDLFIIYEKQNGTVIYSDPNYII